MIKFNHYFKNEIFNNQSSSKYNKKSKFNDTNQIINKFSLNSIKNEDRYIKIKKWIGWIISVKLALDATMFIDISEAVLNSPKANLPRTPEAALRRSIPTFNANVLQIQKYLEDIAFALRIPQRKPWGTMRNDINSSKELIKDRSTIIKGVSTGDMEKAVEIVESIEKTLYQLDTWIEARDQDRVSVRVAFALKEISELEVLQAPGLPFVIPKEYLKLPRLTGRMTIMLKIKKSNDEMPFLNDQKDGVSNVANIKITLDGYSSPISSGTLAYNILNNIFKDSVINADSSFISIKSSLVSNKTKSSIISEVPLEILPYGDFEPSYKLPLEIETGERPVIPLSVYGAVSLPHSINNDEFISDADKFFIYKFNRAQAGLGGMAFEEGMFGVVGYVTEGIDEISKIENGDKVISLEIIDGEDKLFIPQNIIKE